ncbi:MAG: YbgC/FadM family acyl-CoA thioesterase [Candidatus Promineifilaceae bacterium]|nr:YbgC/FadM family acyl-CoA thioesterase [Candidatus Promineifilaceae bacterium]
MPEIFEQTFRARFNECDAYGHVNHAHFLTYMQEAAFDASAAVGYDFSRHLEMKRAWFIRESEITYLRPLRYFDTFIVRTWVVDVRRVRSRRLYEFRLASTAEPVAQAYSDWVFLDSGTLRPASIPEEMSRAYLPEGSTNGVLKRHAFPEPPPPPPGVHTTKRRVRWHDVDPAQHVNNTVYLHYLEDCAIDLVREKGWPLERMTADGFGIVARQFRIEYLQPAEMDQELEISTWVSDVKRATALRHYTIKRRADNQLLARARALWVWVDLETGRPIRIPAQFLADCAANISGSLDAQTNGRMLT